MLKSDLRTSVSSHGQYGTSASSCAAKKRARLAAALSRVEKAMTGHGFGAGACGQNLQEKNSI
jgi:hypothetical protein